MKPLNILIATGIYPPDIGGPAEYAKNTEMEFKKMGNKVSVVYFKLEKHLPTGLRHLLYFLRVFRHVRRADFILILDTFSVALPTVLVAKFFKKTTIIRTGGDFLWESYVERTGEKVLLPRFYQTRRNSFSLKEKIIFRLTKFVLNSVNAVVFSTAWQRDIFLPAYELSKNKCFLIENYYGPKIKTVDYKGGKKIFVAATRSIKFKNGDLLKKAFALAERFDKDIVLDVEAVPHDKFMEKLANCYAVILPSLGEISPNMILDALRVNKPFILSRENGLYERLRNVSVFINPLDKEDIRNKILDLTDKNFYNQQKKAIENFSFTHTWVEICREFLSVYSRIIQVSRK